MIMKVKVVNRNEGWEVVLYYCPQIGRSTVEKEEFYELLYRV